MITNQYIPTPGPKNTDIAQKNEYKFRAQIENPQ